VDFDGDDERVARYLSLMVKSCKLRFFGERESLCVLLFLVQVM